MGKTWQKSGINKTATPAVIWRESYKKSRSLEFLLEFLISMKWIGQRNFSKRNSMQSNDVLDTMKTTRWRQSHADNEKINFSAGWVSTGHTKESFSYFFFFQQKNSLFGYIKLGFLLTFTCHCFSSLKQGILWMKQEPFFVWSTPEHPTNRVCIRHKVRMNIGGGRIHYIK